MANTSLEKRKRTEDATCAALTDHQRPPTPKEDEYFMGAALLAARNSNDPITKVGACVVKNTRIISCGYNAMPKNLDDQFSWDRGKKKPENKHLYVCHAELNAIINMTSSVDVEGGTIYVTLFPCNECAKIIIQSGIKEVVYLADTYSHKSEVKAAKEMFEKVGITRRKYQVLNPSIHLNFQVQ